MLRERIKQLRVRKGYTQNFVAQYLFIKQNTYSDYERGVSVMSIDTLIKLADLYNVSVDYLLGRTNNKSLTK